MNNAFLPPDEPTMRDLIPPAPEQIAFGPFAEYYREEAEFKEQLHARLTGNMPSTRYYHGGAALETARGASSAAVKALKTNTPKSVSDILKSCGAITVITRPPECDELDALLKGAILQRLSAEQIKQICELYATVKKGLKGNISGAEKKTRKATIEAHKETVELLSQMYPIRKMYDDVEFYNQGVNDLCAKFEGKPFFDVPERSAIRMIIEESVEHARERYIELKNESKNLEPNSGEFPITAKLVDKLRVAHGYQLRLRDRIYCTIFIGELRRIIAELRPYESSHRKLSERKTVPEDVISNKLAICSQQIDFMRATMREFRDVEHAGEYYGKFMRLLKRAEQAAAGVEVMPKILGRRKGADDFLHFADHFLALHDFLEKGGKYTSRALLPNDDHLKALYVQYRLGLLEFLTKWAPIYHQGTNPYELFSPEFFAGIRSQGEKSLFITLSKLSKVATYAQDLKNLLGKTIIQTTELADYRRLDWLEKQDKRLEGLLRALDVVTEIYRATLL